jgi:hypothetical protein
MRGELHRATEINVKARVEQRVESGIDSWRFSMSC